MLCLCFLFFCIFLHFPIYCFNVLVFAHNLYNEHTVKNIRENEIPFDLKLSVPASVPTSGLWPVPVWQAGRQSFSVISRLFGFCSASASRMVRNTAAVTSIPGFSPLCLENKYASDNIDFNADMHYNAEEVTVGLSSYLHFIRP